jgi:hypothetical protein
MLCWVGHFPLLSPRFDCGNLLGRENEPSPHRVEDHDAGCFHSVVDEDIRFAVNLDSGLVNRLQSNRPKWFLINSFQDTLDRHAKAKD